MKRYFHSISLFVLLFGLFQVCCEGALVVPDAKLTLAPRVAIRAANVDALVLKGVKHIFDQGEHFSARAGSGLQCYDVEYLLENPLNRLHIMRQAKAKQYLCREFIAYFNGSLKASDGLAQASKFWEKLTDENGEISSNYGYYVFHQRIPEYENKTQFEWVIECLSKNLDSRKAFININQPVHKSSKTKDFPCTIGLQFFVRQNHLCCVVFSRSTDICTGLPYDMGFFSFLTELVFKCVREKLPAELAEQLKLGYTCMKTNFTQIYDQTRKIATELVEGFPETNFTVTNEQLLRMPEIDDHRTVLSDIYNKTHNSKIMKWIYENAGY